MRYKSESHEGKVERTRMMKAQRNFHWISTELSISAI